MHTLDVHDMPAEEIEARLSDLCDLRPGKLAPVIRVRGMQVQRQVLELLFEKLKGRAYFRLGEMRSAKIEVEEEMPQACTPAAALPLYGKDCSERTLDILRCAVNGNLEELQLLLETHSKEACK